MLRRDERRKGPIADIVAVSAFAYLDFSPQHWTRS